MKQAFLLARFAACVLAAAVAPCASAQDNYPSQPIKLVVPYAPGGGTDGVARRLASELRTMGQPVVVENKPGAGAVIGHEFVAKAAPDGYTLIVSANTLAIFNQLYPKLAFDPATAFTPVAIVANSPLVLVGPANSPYPNLARVIDAAREQPDKLTFGSAGAGTPMHLAGEMLVSRAKVRIEHAPYKGSGPLINDVLAGHIPLGIFGLSSTLQFIKDGKLKAYGIFDAKRSPLDPAIPTLAEAGAPGAEAPLIYTILGPAGLPRPVVSRLSQELKRILESESIRQAFAAQGFVPQYGTPEDVVEMNKSEAVRWRAVIRSAGLQERTR